MTMTKGKYIIGTLWGIGFLVLFILMTIQTVNGVYMDRSQEAWEWFTPNILPTIGLIVGVFVADWTRVVPVDGNNTEPPVLINPLMVGVTFILSLTHLLILLVIILIAANKTPIDEIFKSLKLVNLPLGAIQGLVTLTLGMFFKKN